MSAGLHDKLLPERAWVICWSSHIDCCRHPSASWHVLAPVFYRAVLTRFSVRGARLGGEHWSDLAFPPAAEPGQLLGSDSELSQLGQDHPAAGLDHQAGEQDGAFPALPTLAACAAPRRLDARVVQANQASPGIEDRARGSDAAPGDDHLANAFAAAALRDGRPGAQPFCGGEQEEIEARRGMSVAEECGPEIKT